MGLAAWEARISTVLTMACGVRHLLPSLPYVILCSISFFGYLEIQRL